MENDLFLQKEASEFQDIFKSNYVRIIFYLKLLRDVSLKVIRFYINLKYRHAITFSEYCTMRPLFQ